jgi:multimeric flavodoxin WrbA
MPPDLDLRDQELCATARWDFSDLRAVYINCTLKRSPEPSNTQALADRSIAIMRKLGVGVDVIRAVDHDIATGVYPDMTEHGWDSDEWPALFERVMAADILVLLSPIWLGEKSSICTRVIERLYGNSHLLNEHGQWAYYGRVGGCIITGNEDGAKHCAMNILYSLQHLGFVIPPQADAGWIGAAGPARATSIPDQAGRTTARSRSAGDCSHTAARSRGCTPRTFHRAKSGSASLAATARLGEADRPRLSRPHGRHVTTASLSAR